MRLFMFAKMMFVIFSFILFSSCSKEVNKNNLNLTPTSNNPGVSIPNPGSYLSFTFANHSTVQEEDDLFTFFLVENYGLVEVPLYVSSLSYLNSIHHPNLKLYVNNDLVCNYVWLGDRYVAHFSCLTELQLSPNDKMVMRQIPRSQTVSLDMLVK